MPRWSLTVMIEAPDREAAEAMLDVLNVVDAGIDGTVVTAGPLLPERDWH